jgi:hypothetical protein
MFYIVGRDAGIGFDSRYLPDRKLTINTLAKVTNGEAETRSTIMNSLDDIFRGNNLRAVADINKQEMENN